jgi:hypothetical protein
MYDSRLGRWFAVDPLARKYPMLSPYAFVANNPLIYIDPDGKDIIIYLANGTSVKYKPGMSVQTTDKFTKKVIESLNKIYSTSEGAIVVTTLVNSSNNFNISESKYLATLYKLDDARFTLGKNEATFIKYIQDKEFSKAHSLLNNTSDLSIKIYNGNYVTAWDIHRYDGVCMNFTLTVGHELFHAYQFEIGRLDGSFIGLYTEKTGKVPLLEAQAVGFENYLRGSLFKDTKYEESRVFYSSKPISEFREKESRWSWLFGLDSFDPKEFIEGGKAFNIWKKEFHEKGKEKFIKNFIENVDY